MVVLSHYCHLKGKVRFSIHQPLSLPEGVLLTSTGLGWEFWLPVRTLLTPPYLGGVRVPHYCPHVASIDTTELGGRGGLVIAGQWLRVLTLH